MKHLSFVNLALFFGLFAQKIIACQCGPLPPIYQSFEESDAVFIGKVTNSNELAKTRVNDGEDVIFEFEVIENFKGVKEKQVRLNRGPTASSCYSGYRIGETYLVYAASEGFDDVFGKVRKEDGVIFQGSFCHRTSEIRSAQDQLYFLREMLKGNPEPQIYGAVARGDSDPVTSDYRHTFLENIKIKLKNEKATFETLTDNAGLFRFNNIPEGEYVLSPVPGESCQMDFPEERRFRISKDGVVFIKDRYDSNFNSYYGEFLLRWNNGISGRVVDSEGKPFERYVAALLPFPAAGDDMKSYVNGSPDFHGENGDFRFYAKTPGKYVIAVEIYAPFANSTKKRFFYPNSETVSGAKVVDLSSTSDIKALELRMPFTIRLIKGEILWSDGDLIKQHGPIRLKLLKTGDELLNPSFDLDSAENGKFTIRALEGFEYWVHAEVNVREKVNGIERDIVLKAVPQKVLVGKEDFPLKVVFEKPENLVVEK